MFPKMHEKREMQGKHVWPGKARSRSSSGTLDPEKRASKNVYENIGMRHRIAAMLMAQPNRTVADLANSSQVVTALLAARKCCCKTASGTALSTPHDQKSIF